MLLSSLLSCVFVLGAVAQKPAPYTESKSGITVWAYQSSTYNFGIALPQTPQSDFIGVLVGKGSGYLGVSLGGPMLNELLIAAWPNGNAVLSSFRKTAQYGSPAVATGPFSIIPIAGGTYTNTTHFTYTFLCKGCILSDGTTFKATDTSATLGFAYSTKSPTTKTSVTTTFTKHDAQGSWSLDIPSAKTAKYDTWAQLANGTVPTAMAERKFRA